MMRCTTLLLFAAGLSATHAAAAAFEDVSHLQRRAAANESVCVFSQFEQAIDHFGKNNGTFQQRYNLVTEFFQPGGPILLFQGEESRVLDCVGTTLFYSFAKELKGIAVSLEHRYFGTSKPFGVSDPTDPAQLEKFQYLTLDNVMQDGASFIDYLKKNISGATDSEAIVASGSYGGFLATVFRQNHPEAFYGAIASAPPVEGFSTSDTNVYNWNIWVNNVFQDRSFEASKKIESALAVLLDQFKTNATAAALKDQLGLCETPSTNDVAPVYQSLQELYQNAAEFNYPVSRPGRASVALPLDKIINITLTEQDPIKMLNESLWVWWGPTGASCIDYSAAGVANAVPLIETPVFQYLTCKYLPDQAGVAYANGTFVPGLPGGAPLDGVFAQSCKEWYNISTPSQEQLQKQYHYTPAELRNSTRIIWSLGQYDPTSGISPNQSGINAPPLSADRNVSRILYTTNMAHREDLFAEDPSDRETVKQTRRIELESIKGWLGGYCNFY